MATVPDRAPVSLCVADLEKKWIVHRGRRSATMRRQLWDQDGKSLDGQSRGFQEELA